MTSSGGEGQSVDSDAVRGAAIEVAEASDDPDGRYALAQRFYAGMAESHYARAQLSFMRWEIKRGVLNPPGATAPGSAWWRAVNEQILRDQTEARLLLAEGHASGGSTPGTTRWLAFLASPSSAGWYLAHNSSVVAGYLTHAPLAQAESQPEVALINLVLTRVLFAHLLAAEPKFVLGRAPAIAHYLGDPRSDSVGLVVDIPDFYPRDYPLPAPRHDSWRSVLAHPVSAVEALAVEFIDDHIVDAHCPTLFDWAARTLAMAKLASVVDGKVPAYPWRVLGQPDPSDHRARRPSELSRLVTAAVNESLGARPARW
jgi:hypothetical protein